MVNENMIIGEILETNKQVVVPILLEAGLHCLGCPSAQGETLSQAAAVHGIDAKELVDKINKALQA